MMLPHPTLANTLSKRIRFLKRKIRLLDAQSEINQKIRNRICDGHSNAYYKCQYQHDAAYLEQWLWSEGYTKTRVIPTSYNYLLRVDW